VVEEAFSVADTLYELIGGKLTVRAAVESFYRRVLADPSLSHFFHEVDMDHLRARQSMFLSMLVGGKMLYTGRDIRTAHSRPREIGLTDVHFDTFLYHFRAALEEVGVQPDKLDKVMTLLEGTRDAVLNHRGSPP
jgi:hemoglobin